jgi:hypothetical protein
VSVDGVADSIVDLSYHAFTVADSETSLHVDSVRLPAYNATADTLRIVRDSVSLVLASAVKLDSAVLYYKDVASPSFDVARIRDSLATYTFKVRPQKDGSVLQYYFRAYKGGDEYGYSQEAFNAFVAPDSTRLTKLEITPSPGDTMLLPSDYEMSFVVKGYYGSQFFPATRMDSAGISWQLAGPAGGSLLNSRGLKVTVHTSISASAAAVQLKAVIDTTRIRLDGRWIKAPELSLFFRTSGKKIAAIQVRRVDALSPDPITTSPLSKAEFIADGLDPDKNVFVISPAWSISPEGAGAITTDGVFRPNKKFAGRVRIWAQSGTASGEFGAAGKDQSLYGLEVRHIVAAGPEPDTVTNLSGCTIILPDSVVPPDKSALIQITQPVVDNQVARTSGTQTVLGQVYDIRELNDVVFRLTGGDSIQIVLNVPQGFANAGKMSIGCWNDDSLRWAVVAGSKTAADKQTVSASITHFSRYAVLAQTGGLQSTLSVLPNPFSPLRSPSEFPKLAQIFGPAAPRGTCISFMLDVPDKVLRKMRVRIYTLQGDLVCSVVNQDMKKMVQYNLWWDGRTSPADMQWGSLPQGSDEYTKLLAVSGGRMCNNGRYFVMLTIEDSEGKEKSYMQQVVLVR